MESGFDYSLYEWVEQGTSSPMEVVSSQGCSFITGDGREVLDFVSQLMVANLGHSLEPIHSAVYRQSATLGYVTPAAATAPRRKLSRKLRDVVPEHISHFFFSTSGTEANNDAIRIARTVTGRSHVLYRGRSYHGSHGPAAMSSGDPRRSLMEHEPSFSVPFRSHSGSAQEDIAAFRWAVEAVGPEKIAALIIESVPGGSGVMVPPDGALQGIEAICREHGIQLICDEVLTGFGRTGKWFSFEHWGLRPDLMTMGKALGGGVAPLGAVGVSEEIARTLQTVRLGTGHTFNSYPLGCVAACAALDLYAKTGAVERAAELGPLLGARLRAAAERSSVVRETRSIGMLAAVETTQDPAPIQAELLRRGVYVLAKGDNLLIAPPLVIDREELGRGLDIVARTLEEWSEAPRA
ncbi:class-III pyridoxal-phosphate-dependent aminotransferase [Streptomyces goshikiensis]|uniref:class-III pyridoxal-phosphate-dependent aminotransferase n=1 Tax=Streptomyces goshikiensis TaxID=1942 RepID=UPI0036C79880